VQFTPQELKLIERLRTQERQWARTKWVLLVTACCLLVTYSCLASILYSHFFNGFAAEASRSDLVLLMFSLSWPVILMMSGIVGFLLGLVIKDWRGNAQRLLLLRLLDARENETRGSQTEAIKS